MEPTQDQAREMANWILKGCPSPPPGFVKLWQVAQLLIISKATSFIETGTLTGGTSGAVARSFPAVNIHTIEVSQKFYDLAKQERLASLSNVTQHLGDSKKLLPTILADISCPSVFWLDAHYSGGDTEWSDAYCPTLGEIQSISSYFIQGSIIIIDDMRDFRGVNSYPTISELKEALFYVDRNYKTIIRNDSLVFAPPEIIDRFVSHPIDIKDLQLR